jgi:RHS repeat-associated protein
LVTGADLTYRSDGRLGGVVDAYDAGAVSTYSYDDAGQLTAAAGALGGDHAYTYGPGGLRLERSIDATATSYTWSPGGRLDQIHSAGTTTTRTHDAAGRLTTMTVGGLEETTWVHDAGGRPVERTEGTPGCHQADSCAQVSLRRFDGDGKLVGTGDSTYAWDPAGAQLGRAPQILEGVIEGGWLNGVSVRSNYGLERLYLDWQTPSGGGLAYWIAQDHLGSTIATTAYDAPGGYDPYGVPDTPTNGGFGYRGELTLDDEVHLRARDYHPDTGLFSTPDPLDSVDATPTNGHTYHYADNDPLNKTDPLGLRPGDGSITDGQAGAACDSVGGRLVWWGDTGSKACLEPGGANGTACWPPESPGGNPIVMHQGACAVQTTEITCARGPSFLDPICRNADTITAVLTVIAVGALGVATGGAAVVAIGGSAGIAIPTGGGALALAGGGSLAGGGAVILSPTAAGALTGSIAGLGSLIHMAQNADGSGGGNSQSAYDYATRPEKLDHIFVPKHKLDPLVQQFGSREAVVRKMLDSLIGRTPASGIFEVTSNIGGYGVVIRGAVVGGAVRIGTAFIP